MFFLIFHFFFFWRHREAVCGAFFGGTLGEENGEIALDRENGKILATPRVQNDKFFFRERIRPFEFCHSPLSVDSVQSSNLLWHILYTTLSR